MIIRAIKQNLLEGLSHVMRAISGKNTNPIFSCIHLIAKDGKLTMITTDNEIRIETKIPVAIEAEGETVIFAKNFYDLVRRLPDVPITMSSVSKDGKGNTCPLYVLHIFHILAVVCSAPNRNNVDAIGHAFERPSHVRRLGVPSAKPTKKHLMVGSLLISTKVGIILFALYFGLNDF